MPCILARVGPISMWELGGFGEEGFDVMRLGTTVVLAVLCAFGSIEARAQDSAEDGANEGDARMHFRLGRAYHESGRFAEAATEFQRAYELSGRPALLYNVFVAHRDAGNLGPAIGALREYLRLNPDAEEREQLTARLAAMERLAEQQGVAVAQPATTGTTTSAAPTPTRSDTPAGGSTWTPGWILVGVGAAAVAGGIVTGILALGEQAALADLCDDARLCDPGFEGTRDSAALLAGLTDGLLIGGAVIAVTGVILALVVPSGEDPPARASLMCTGDGCFGAATLRF